tara:strand:- start:2452 stop:2703 length:252 start_codon:yes stop_codon:yes gene_type:complete
MVNFMSLKDQAIREFKALMSEFDISPTRLSRDLFNDPSFYTRLKKPDTRVTDTTLDTLFRHAVKRRGQVEMTLIVGEKERSKV